MPRPRRPRPRRGRRKNPAPRTPARSRDQTRAARGNRARTRDRTENRPRTGHQEPAASSWSPPSATERNRTHETGRTERNAGRNGTAGLPRESQPDVSRLTAGPGLRAWATDTDSARTDTNGEGDVPDSEPHVEGPEGQRPRIGRTGRDSRTASRSRERRRTTSAICTSRSGSTRTRHRTHRPADQARSPEAGPASKPRTCGRTRADERERERTNANEPDRTNANEPDRTNANERAASTGTDRSRTRRDAVP